MDKNYNLFSFCITLSVIVLFNVLQAEKKANTNPYSWTNFEEWIENNNPLVNREKKRRCVQDMKNFGSADMDKGDQEKMRQALHEMGIKNPEKVPLKKLSKEGIVRSTGIWTNPYLSKSRADHVRYQVAQKYWEWYGPRGINEYEQTLVAFSFSLAFAPFAPFFLRDYMSKAIFVAGGLYVAKTIWKKDNYSYKVKKQQLKILRFRGYEDLAANVEKGYSWIERLLSSYDKNEK